MQADAIINRILSDGKLKAEEVIEQAKLKAFNINKEAEEYASTKLEETKNIANERTKQIEDRYVVLSHIEGNKIILNKKQEIILDLKQKALEEFLKLEKTKMLSFIEKLLKQNAAKGETLKINVSGITVKDVESLKVVKDKSLKVTLNKDKTQIGLILSSAVMDKNLIFSELINSSYEACQGEVGKILFGE